MPETISRCHNTRLCWGELSNCSTARLSLLHGSRDSIAFNRESLPWVRVANTHTSGCPNRASARVSQALLEACSPSPHLDAGSRLRASFTREQRRFTFFTGLPCCSTARQSFGAGTPRARCASAAGPRHVPRPMTARRPTAITPIKHGYAFNSCWHAGLCRSLCGDTRNAGHCPSWLRWRNPKRKTALFVCRSDSRNRSKKIGTDNGHRCACHCFDDCGIRQPSRRSSRKAPPIQQ
jgi:hypothetical protein